MKKDSKRVKINFKTINGLEGFKPLEIDWEARRKEQQEQIEADKKRYEEEVAIEAKRVKKMCCPACKGTEKNRIRKTENNGVYGPGCRSWVVDDYYICLGCGVHFTDLKQKDIVPPKSKNDYFF